MKLSNGNFHLPAIAATLDAVAIAFAQAASLAVERCIKFMSPTFTDLPLQCTWESSRGQAGESGILTNFLGGAGAKPFTTERFEIFREELNRVFPGVTGKFDGQRIGAR